MGARHHHRDLYSQSYAEVGVLFASMPNFTGNNQLRGTSQVTTSCVARHFMGARHHHRDLYSQSYAEVGVLFASMPNFTGNNQLRGTSQVTTSCVARHFMGARHHHRDLYSQSYAEVGVLFASMPNFTEFYSEETVNNQGLECLRFLNEVISDFDLLLEKRQFSNDIIKIKTISSTYMAASGLNPTRQMQPEDAIRVRWEHLANLVEFALELQRVLAAINEQSFNHFVLRMGVNHGPITAGVIGARKPHYDIWGNTVNVASRMESTGKAGCIQVTEETCHILEEFGYYFEQRGLVAVKGKGQLMTYYLQGKNEVGTPPKPTVEEPVNPEPSAADALLANGGAAPAPAGAGAASSGAAQPLLA
ncbi:adenylate and guanylate cyclase catalytic domain-containing protein [Phthorimaea operculella]|nr:adenylate and guanylate cyclase catalytic domain-containing protein [Phthorimaea operculella]